MCATAMALAETENIARETKAGEAAAKSWAALRESELAPVRAFLEEVEGGGTPTIGKLALAAGQIQKLAAESH